MHKLSAGLYILERCKETQQNLFFISLTSM